MLHPGVRKRGRRGENWGHKKGGIVVEVGAAVRGAKRGQMCVGTRPPPHASIKLPYWISLTWVISKERPL